MPYQVRITEDTDASVHVDETHADMVDAMQSMYTFVNTWGALPGIIEYTAPDMNSTPFVWTWKIDDGATTFTSIVRQVA
jgi:hypothetical protein